MSILKLIETKLFENKQQAKQMFEALDSIVEELEVPLYHEMRKVLFDGALKLKSDRRMWMLRICRVGIANYLTNLPIENKETHEEIYNLYKKYQDDFIRKSGDASFDFILKTPDQIKNWFSEIAHFDGIPYEPLQSYVYESQSPDKLISELREIEEKYKQWAREFASMAKMQEGDEILISFPPEDGEKTYHWVLLNRAACPIEAKSMGHCGNSPRKHTNDRILSLRSEEDIVDGVQYYKPRLTFVIEEDGYLGERKGRGNQKPAPHYHPYIVKLLRHPMVKGIKEGHWFAQGDFSIDDLEPDVVKDLIKENPNLADADTYVKLLGLTDDILQKMQDETQNRTTNGKNSDPRNVLTRYIRSNIITVEQFKDAIKKFPYFSASVKQYLENGKFDEGLIKYLHDINRTFSSLSETHTLNDQIFEAGLSKDNIKHIHKNILSLATVKHSYKLYGGMSEEVQRVLGRRLSSYHPTVSSSVRIFNHEFGVSDITINDWKIFYNHMDDGDDMVIEYIAKGISDLKDDIQEHINDEGVITAKKDLLIDEFLGASDEYKKLGRQLIEEFPILMGVEDLVELSGIDKDDEAFPFMERKKYHDALIEKMEERFNIQEYWATLEWNEDKKVFEVELSDVDDFVDQYGNDTIKKYYSYINENEGLEEAFDSHYDADISHNVDDLPLHCQYLIRENVWENIDEDEKEEFESFDDFLYSDAVSKGEENNLDIIDNIKDAVSKGWSYGAAKEAYDDLHSTIVNATISIGEIVYKNKKEEKTIDDVYDFNLYLSGDITVYYVFTIDELSELINVEFDEGNLTDIDYNFEMKMNEPSYGYQGFDKDTFIYNFIENTDSIDIPERPEQFTVPYMDKIPDTDVEKYIIEIKDKIEEYDSIKKHHEQGTKEKDKDYLKRLVKEVYG